MSNEFDPEAFWEAYEEQQQDKDFFESKLREQEHEKKPNIVEFPLVLRFEMDIEAIESRLHAISHAVYDLMAEVSSLKKRFVKKQ